MSAATLVVPCYNEARRLNAEAFRAFVASEPATRVVFVNDGSTDDTRRILRGIQASAPERVEVVDFSRNAGKAEAVRRGLLCALDGDAGYVGYWDADLSTPLEAFSEFVALLDARPSIDIVIGSRVQLLGRTIERRALRHYVGRIFATAASLTLRLPVYDTQCGAKLFRASPRLRQAVAEPFRSTWAFDVELIARYGATLSPVYTPERLGAAIYELPLQEWRHVGDSKVRPHHLIGAILDLARIRRVYTRSR